MTSARPSRRRRADAERSRAAIVDAAFHLLSERPDASVEAIATAAGVTRQTVYAHFPSRDAVLAAVVDRVTAQVVATLEAARLDDGSATDALIRLLDTSWDVVARHPWLRDVAAAPVAPEVDHERHGPITERLVRILERGRAAGELDDRLPVPWLADAILALGHAAGLQANTGRASAEEARAALNETVRRIVAPPDGARRR